MELLLVKLLLQPLLGMDIPNSFRNLPEKYFPQNFCITSYLTKPFSLKNTTLQQL